jgi:hypothetical protein
MRAVGISARARIIIVGTDTFVRATNAFIKLMRFGR